MATIRWSMRTVEPGIVAKTGNPMRISPLFNNRPYALSSSLITKEIPRLCRGGSKSLTVPAVTPQAPTDAIPVIEPRIQEVTIGSWDGLTQIDIDAGWPGRLDGCNAYDWFFRAPDGESYQEALVCVSSWLMELKGATVAVSHGLAGRIIRGAYLGLTREQTLLLPVPQEIIWHLVEHCVEALALP